MQWNFKVYEQPGILFADRTVEADEAPIGPVEELMKPGLEDGRKLLAVITSLDGDRTPMLVPRGESVDVTLEELTKQVTELLSEGESYGAATLCDGALRGSGGEDPEVMLLAASVFEHIRLHQLVVPLLQQVEAAWDGLRRAAVQIRLARALRKSGLQSDVRDRLEEPLEHPELPPILKGEGLLLKALSSEPDEALETLDELLDYAEEHLGDHRLVADALELHADILSDTQPKRAEHFYHAAGKMLVKLKDPYFFALNERFVIHFLKHKQYKEAVNLSHEMFELIKQAEGPSVAAIPYFVFAGYAHEQLGDNDRSAMAMKMADDIDKTEARRIAETLKSMLEPSSVEV